MKYLLCYNKNKIKEDIVMEKFTEENLNVICDEVYDEIKNESELDEDSVVLSEVNVTLNVIKKFILKMQNK